MQPSGWVPSLPWTRASWSAPTRSVAWNGLHPAIETRGEQYLHDLLIRYFTRERLMKVVPLLVIIQTIKKESLLPRGRVELPVEVGKDSI